MAEKNDRFKVLISRCQQLALQKGSGVLVDPAKELELMNAKRQKEPRGHRGDPIIMCWFIFLTLIAIILSIQV